MLFAIGCELLLVDILRYMNVPAPCRISSLPQGAALRPGIYAYIEDICAVDGSGGTEFRQRLNLRYTASKGFRMMLHRLTLFWAIGAIITAVVCTAIIFTIQRDAAYVVCPSDIYSTLSILTAHRSAGFCPSFGLVSGLPSPSPGSNANSRKSTKNGPPQTSRPRRLRFPFVYSCPTCTISHISLGCKDERSFPTLAMAFCRIHWNWVLIL
jgi:hypothetical protein